MIVLPFLAAGMQALWLELKQLSCAMRWKTCIRMVMLGYGKPRLYSDQPPAAVLALDSLTKLFQGREIKLFYLSHCCFGVFGHLQLNFS